jgi:hypothetical protein
VKPTVSALTEGVIMSEKGFWRSPRKIVGPFRILDEGIRRLLAQNPDGFPDLRSTSTVLIASDYSGDHSGSKYKVLSFLFADIEGCQEWDEERSGLRAGLLPDKRRMSFKELSHDKQRQRALAPFLTAANAIPGLVFTVAIDSAIDSLFEGVAPLDLSNPDFAAFRRWKPRVLEKAFRAIHFTSFLLAGLSRPGQNVLWFTDEDAIVANLDRLTQFTSLFAWIASSYLAFNLGHLRCGTTQCDDGSLIVEDLAAIPDLIAGSVRDQLQLVSDVGPDLPGVFWIHRGDFPNKTSFINWWLSDTTKPLKRVLCLLDPAPNEIGFVLSWFHFHNQV